MAVNSDAVAWYLTRAERVLEEHRRRVESVRGRAAQLAGFSGAILTLAGVDADTILSSLHGAARGWAGICLLVGSALLIAAFVVAVRGALVSPLEPDLSAGEVANYATDRFVEESDLWRVQLRTVRAMYGSIESATRLVERATRAMKTAQRYFFGGLSLIGCALGTLVLVVAF